MLIYPQQKQMESTIDKITVHPVGIITVFGDQHRKKIQLLEYRSIIITVCVLTSPCPAAHRAVCLSCHGAVLKSRASPSQSKWRRNWFSVCCRSLMFSQVWSHPEGGKMYRQSNLCKLKPDINWATDRNPEMFICPTSAQTCLWDHRIIWDLATQYLIILHRQGQFQCKSARRLTWNSPSALYFFLMPFWRNRSKFFFSRRCKGSKG